MGRLTHRYAGALLDYAKQHGLEMMYHQALLYAAGKLTGENELTAFLDSIPDQEREAVNYRFIDLAWKTMDVVKVEIISAVPLTERQVSVLEVRLIKKLRKQLEIKVTVDPSILGGVRIIAGNIVIDDTIKRKISDMKNGLFKRLYG